MASCVMCGSSLPDNQGSSTCSMCYGDIDHGHDGYYQDYIEQQERSRQEQEQQQEERDAPS